ncbi:unnamed protein product [Phytomonas sp. EM1]|nr:unnamed protein product [Phytomonas sp. EM1]|eukprot:CCW62744.1 unnamed protein product [Phytomonas sp. isolate EM1]
MRVGRFLIPHFFDNDDSGSCFLATSPKCVVEEICPNNSVVWSADERLLEAKTIVDRAAALHHAHQEPFKLSRIAASHAMSCLLARKGHATLQETPFAFSGTREEALRDYGTHLSLSHETFIGGALAWSANPTGTHSTGSPGMTVFALDIVDVLDVERVSCRFPERMRRLLTPRVPLYDSFLENDHSNNEDLARELCIPAELLSSTLDSENTLMKASYPSFSVLHPLYTVSQCILAQRWSLRECCVKLLGIPHRAFNYACVECDGGMPEGRQGCGGFQRSLPSGLWHPNTLYVTRVVGEERAVFKSRGLVPHLQVISMFKCLKTLEGELRPVVVTMASCKRLSC